MSYITERNAIRSLNEQKKAIKEMFLLFPGAIFEPGCNSFNSRNYSSFEAKVPFEKFVPIATRYIIRHDDLFDFSRPKVVGPQWHIWNDLVSVKLYWYGKYNYYHTDDWRPRKLSKIQQSISLCSCSYRQGLRHWKTRFSKLRNLLNKNPDKELVKAYKVEIDEINNEVLKWEEALHEASKIDLNGKQQGRLK